MQLNPGSYLIYNQLQKCRHTSASDTSVSITLTLFLSSLQICSSKNKVSEHGSVLPATFPRGEGWGGGGGGGRRGILIARSSTGRLSPNKLQSVKYFCNWIVHYQGALIKYCSTVVFIFDVSHLSSPVSSTI